MDELLQAYRAARIRLAVPGDEGGQTAVEYVAIIVLVAAIIVAILTTTDIPGDTAGALQPKDRGDHRRPTA